jgi:RNA polymerase sigma factor for flagellar operon FliA
MKNGNDREAFLEANLPLVKRVYARLRIGLPARIAEQLEEDLLSAGAIGLIQAYDKYDNRPGTAFSSFATHRIRGAMLDELRRQDWLSKQARTRLKEIQRAYAALEQSQGRPASDEEVAARLKIDVEQLREEFVEIGPATLVFLEGLGGTQESSDWKNFIADPDGCSPEQAAEKKQIFENLKEAVGRLPQAEATVLKLLLEEELGQMEIAEVLGVTPSRVSQIYSKAVARLQGSLLPLFER